VLNNGDALTWWDLQGELQGVPVNVARGWAGAHAGASNPTRRMAAGLKDLRAAPPVSRNRDMAWDRLLDKKSAERLIGVDLTFWRTGASGLR
jgi:hypothetical protein